MHDLIVTTVVVSYVTTHRIVISETNDSSGEIIIPKQQFHNKLYYIATRPQAYYIILSQAAVNKYHFTLHWLQKYVTSY